MTYYVINSSHMRISGSVAVLSFEVLELSRGFADLQEIQPAVC